MSNILKILKENDCLEIYGCCGNFCNLDELMKKQDIYFDVCKEFAVEILNEFKDIDLIVGSTEFAKSAGQIIANLLEKEFYDFSDETYDISGKNVLIIEGELTTRKPILESSKALKTAIENGDKVIGIAALLDNTYGKLDCEFPVFYGVELWSQKTKYSH